MLPGNLFFVEQHQQQSADRGDSIILGKQLTLAPSSRSALVLVGPRKLSSILQNINNFETYSYKFLIFTRYRKKYIWRSRPPAVICSPWHKMWVVKFKRNIPFLKFICENVYYVILMMGRLLPKWVRAEIGARGPTFPRANLNLEKKSPLDTFH